MSRIETLTQDYNRVPVPDGKTVNAWHIALIKIGIVIALPAFFTGAEIGAAMGLADACLVVIVAAFSPGAACRVDGYCRSKFHVYLHP